MTSQQDHARSSTWERAGRTTLILERDEDGRWRATQDGVDAVGRGHSAQTAAANYCLAVADDAGTDDV